MSLVSANGVAVIGGTIIMPLLGVWRADLILDQSGGNDFPAGTSVSLKAQDGIELDGTVVPDRTGVFLDAVHIRILGGAAGMSKTVTPKGFVQPGAYVRDVLKNINDASGETLDDSVSSLFLQSNLAAWNTIAEPASNALSVLLDITAPTFTWRILGNGKLWMGEETWPDDQHEFSIISSNPAENSFELGVSSPSIEPGVTVAGIGKVNRAEHTIESSKIRTRVWVDVEGSERGFRAGIAKIVQQENARIDYFTLYDAKIIAQSSDGATVDVQPGDTRLPGMSNVPLRNGVAGTICKVSPGAFVRLGWDRGSPSMPYACLWQGGESVTRISFAGDTDAARKGDHSDAGTWAFAFTPGPAAALSITYTDPDGTVTTLAAGTGTVLAKAKLTEGSSKVGLG